MEEEHINTQENEEGMRSRLGDEAYRVTQEGATERPFTGKYYKNKRDGMYHCKVCSAPLFSSDTKFDSYTGWPSFFDPMKEDAVAVRPDDSGGMIRTEVICKKCGSHLGHLFEDAPETPTGQRYCVNSCALSFKDKDGNDVEEE